MEKIRIEKFGWREEEIEILKREVENGSISQGECEETIGLISKDNNQTKVVKINK